MSRFSRRAFLRTAGAASAALSLGTRAYAQSSPFKVGVISDEISPDFEHACHVISKEFGLKWVELRELWGKNLQQASDAELAKVETILAKYSLQVSDIASPLFKVSWPGAPPSRFASKADLHGATDTEYKQQDEVLARAIAQAKRFKSGKIRCFDFWRLDDIAPYRKSINERLTQAAEATAKHGIVLVLENEHACNTATGRESAATLAAIPNRNVALNWDPGNAVMHGELDAFPVAWKLIPKDRIQHCHVKNAVKDASGKVEWSPVDVGIVDWAGQFRALKAAGYTGTVNLETHWKGSGTMEEASRTSWAGMKKRLAEAGCW